MFIKNLNYIVKINDLIVLNYKFNTINKFYRFNLNNFLEINYNIKSLYVVRYPYISEILTMWSQKVFNRNLYSVFFL